MTVTACFATRNHADILPAAIETARAVADAVVVADTGSNDGTVDVAKTLGAVVESVAWADDFSAACNAALDAVATEWVLWLNPDERVVPGDWPDLRGLTPGIETLAYRVRVRHEAKDREPERCPFDYQVRLFRKHPAVRYRGRLHPHFDPPISETARSVGWGVDSSAALIRRLSHLSTATPDKIRWTNRLLEAELRDRPGQLGLEIEWGRNLLAIGEMRGHDVLAAAARTSFAAPLPTADEHAIGPLFEYLLNVTAENDRSGIARETVRAAARSRFPNSPPVLWALAGERFRSGDFVTAAGDLRKLLAIGKAGQSYGSFDPDIVGPAAAVNLAICSLHFGRFDDAKTLLEPLTSDPRWQRDAADLTLEIAARSGRPT